MMKFKVKKVLSKKKVLGTVWQRHDLPINKYQKCNCRACTLKIKTRKIKIPKGYSFISATNESGYITINFIETL